MGGQPWRLMIALQPSIMRQWHFLELGLRSATTLSWWQLMANDKMTKQQQEVVPEVLKTDRRSTNYTVLNINCPIVSSIQFHQVRFKLLSSPYLHKIIKIIPNSTMRMRIFILVHPVSPPSDTRKVVIILLTIFRLFLPLGAVNLQK